MKRAHILLSITLVNILPNLSAQRLYYEPEFDSLGVASVRTIITQNNDTVLWETKRYNPEGYEISLNYTTPPGKYHVSIYDTLIFRSPEMFSWIDRGDRRTYDSSHTIERHGMNDTTVQTYYKNGKPAIIEYYTGTERDLKIIRHYPLESGLTTVHMQKQEFDADGRLIREHVTDSNYLRSKRELRTAYGRFITYGEQFRITRGYKISNGDTSVSFLNYCSNDSTVDSTIVFMDDGRIDYTFIQYKNSEHKDSLSVALDHLGQVTNRNYTSYTSSARIIRHADGNGFVFKTNEVTYNENHLPIKQVETDLKFGDVRTTYFSYGYY